VYVVNRLILGIYHNDARFLLRQSQILLFDALQVTLDVVMFL